MCYSVMVSMSPEDIRLFAQAIAEQQVDYSWGFYLVWLALALIASAIGGWVGAYFKRRGEHHATKADFDGLVDQLKKTTEAAEGVRTDIAHNDWTAREWKTIRRLKAEELLFEAEKARQLFMVKGSEYLFSDLKVYEDAGARVHMLAMLYFPEALIPAIHLEALLSEGTNLLLDIRSEMNSEDVPIDLSTVRGRRLHEVIEHTAKLEEPLHQMREIVRACLWQTFNLPEYVQNAELAAAVMSTLPVPQAAHTPSTSAPHPQR